MLKRSLLRSSLLVLLIIMISACGSSKRVSTSEFNRDLEEEMIGKISRDIDSTRLETSYVINDSLFDVSVIITEIEFEVRTDPKDSSLVSLPKREKRTEVKTSERVTRKDSLTLIQTNTSSVKDSIEYRKADSIISSNEDKSERKESQTPKYLFWGLLILCSIFIYAKIKGVV